MSKKPSKPRVAKKAALPGKHPRPFAKNSLATWKPEVQAAKKPRAAPKPSLPAAKKSPAIPKPVLPGVRNASAPPKPAKPPVARRAPAPKIVVAVKPASAASPAKRPIEAAPHLDFPSKLEDSRQAFVCLSWFEFLLKRMPVRELPFLIDQYRKIGWIDDNLHAWFITMAKGVGGVRTKAGEMQFARQEARGLVTIHKETLRFLKQLGAAAPKDVAPGNAPMAKAPLPPRK
jgi:hypothetical protein